MLKPEESDTSTSSTVTERTSPQRGPWRRRASKSSRCRGVPLACTSTSPFARFCAQPVTSRARAACCVKARKPTPCTRPEITKRRVVFGSMPADSTACYDSARVSKTAARAGLRVAAGLALIFDLDGVIVDSMPVHELAWRRYLESLGFDGGDIPSRMHGRRNDEIVRDFLGEAMDHNTV